MSHLQSQENPLHCTHCARPVRPTMHRRETWQVDHYLQHTGEVEPAVLRRGEEGNAIEYQRLVRPFLVVTCADCYRRPDIRASRLFPEEIEN